MSVDSDNAKLYIKTSISIFLFVVVGLLSWAILVPLEGAVISQGKLVIESYLREVQHLEGGITREILITEGQYVEKNQVLIKLDDTAYRAKYDSLMFSLMVKKIIHAGLKSSLAGTDLPSVEKIVGAKNIDERLLEIYENQVSLYRTNRLGVSIQLEENQGKLNAALLSLKASEINLKLANDDIEYLKDKMISFRELSLKNFVSVSELKDISYEYQKSLDNKAILEISIGAEKLTIESLALEKSNIINSYDNSFINNLNSIQSELLLLGERIVEVEDKLARTIIYSPVSGTVINLSVNTIGAVVQPGEIILNIAPIGEPIIVEANVPPDKIDQISHNARAWVHFSAFSRKSTPIALATVNRISIDVKYDEVKGVDYYLVSLSFLSDIERILGDRKIMPGMPVEVYIRTEDRNAISYLMKPFTDSMSRTFKE